MRLQLSLAVAAACLVLSTIDGTSAPALGRTWHAPSSHLAQAPAASGAQAFAGPPCGAASETTLAAVDGLAAERIYTDELTGAGTVRDRRQVEEYTPLLVAMAERNAPATRAAVTALVYSHTHIVRLRVARQGAVVADVGGPYIIAPVEGTLRYRGAVVGTYVLSVQDDLGYVGLEKRFIGLPLTLSSGHRNLPIKGTLQKTGRQPLPARGRVTIRHHGFEVYSFTATAFASAPLRVSILRPSARASRSSCLAVRVAETGRIGHRIWTRFLVNNTPISTFARFAGYHTGSLVYVRAGEQIVSGSTSTAPSHLPVAGFVRFHGRRYAVTSFFSARPVKLRVFQLVAA
jgi:hypothetical protein